MSTVSRGRGRKRGVGRSQQPRVPTTAESCAASTEGSNAGVTQNQGSSNGGISSIPKETCASCSMLKKVTEQRDSQLEEINEYKQKVEEQSNIILEHELSLKVFKQKIISMDKELNTCRLEIQNLTKLNEEMRLHGCSNTPSKRRKKMEEQLRKTVDNKYMSVAFLVERMLPTRVAQETMERVLVGSNLSKKNWNGRMESNCSFGVSINGIGILAPYSPFTVAMVHEYYIPSVNTINEFLSDVVHEVLLQDEYASMAEETKKEIILNLSSDKTLGQRTKQIMSDTIGRRKRIAKDVFFDMFNYKSLKTSYDRMDKPVHSRSEEIKIAKERLIKENVEGMIDYSWWRMGRSNQLYITEEVPDQMKDEEVMHPLTEPAEEENRFSVESFSLFRVESRMQVLRKFIGYDVDCGNDGAVDSTILGIARLDAWMVTVIKLLKDSDNKGGARQKEYANTYNKHLRLATQQLIGEIRCFVQYWCPEELQVPQISGNDHRSAILGVHRSATLIIQVPSTGEIYIALKASWFNEYICSEIGLIHDCYLAKVSSTWDEIYVLGSPFQEDIIDPVEYDAGCGLQENVSGADDSEPTASANAESSCNN